MKKKLIVLIIGACLITVGLSGCQESEKKPPVPLIVTEIANIIISEIFYSATNELDDFVELYVWDDNGSSVNITDWYITTFDGFNESLPSVSNLGNYNYISIKMGIGIDDLDASDGQATIYLDRLDSILANFGDEVGLYASNDELVDFVRYAGGNGDPVLGNWDDDDLGESALESDESLQIMGPDHDSSINWIASETSEANPNVLDFTATPYNIKVYLHNGIREGFQFTTKYKVPFNVTDISPSNPLPNATVQKFKEYVSFSLDLYNKSGFNDPETGSDGVLDVNLRNASSSSGETDPTDGSITIDVSGNEVADKWTVEHELIHAIHAKKYTDSNGNGWYRIAPMKYNFKEEGLCEYWGLRSAMQNFNLTFDEAMEEAKKGYGSSWILEEFLNDTNTNIFSEWPDSGWGRYIGSLLYFRYIAETYGIDKTLHIYNSQKNYDTSDYDDIGENDTVGHDAITKAFTDQPNHTGTTFIDSFINFTTWLWENYGDKIALKLNTSFNGSANITETGTLKPWGVHYEKVKIETENAAKINFDGDSGTNYSVTVVKKKGNETTKETQTFKGSKEISIGQGNDEVIIIKRQINGDTSTTYKLNITEGTVETEYEEDNFEPVAYITTSDPTTGLHPLTINLSAETSFDIDGDIVSYHWCFGEGNTSEGVNVTHQFTTPGTYVVTLTVTDDEGATGTDTVTIYVE